MTPDVGNGRANSATKFKIVCFNANSIGKNPKRQKILKFLLDKNPDFVLINDTRLGKNTETAVRDEWEGRCIFNSFNSQARGVAIFLKKNNPAKILDSFKDDNGNVLAILIDYEGKRILLQTLYGPNQDSPNFYSDLVFNKIEQWMPDYSIFAGDWNVILDQNKDTKNYLHINNQNSIETIKEQINQHNLI